MRAECCDGDFVCCVDGDLFGFCDSEDCGGCCEPWGKCDCDCHEETSK